MRITLVAPSAAAAFFVACGSGGGAPGFGPPADNGAGAADAATGGDVTGFGMTDASPDGGEQRHCSTDADCDDGNPCSSFHCDKSSEFGTCTYAPVADGTPCGDAGACGATDACKGGICVASGGSSCGDGGTYQPPIDPMCTCPNKLAGIFPSYVPLQPPDVPPSCSNGFEIGGATGGCGQPSSTYTIHATRAGGANAITLDVDLATYLIQDGVEITGVDANGKTYTLLSECRMQTWTQPGPSTMRPPDVSIRQFRIKVTQGTTALTFDFGNVVSPMYIQVLGLCDFDVAAFSGAAWWQSVP